MLAPFAFRQEATWTRHRTENGSRGSAAPAPRGFRIIHPAHTVPTNLATEPRASLFTSSSINIPVFNIHHVETIVSEADQGAHERQEIDTTDSRETIEREADARQAHHARDDRRTGALPCAQGASARQGSRARRVPGTSRRGSVDQGAPRSAEGR